MVKKLWVVLGFVSIFLGVLGTILPVMPTVPFLFVAYYCFNKGSDRFRKWYLRSKFHKQYLKAVRFYKSVPKIYKILYVIGVLAFFVALVTVYYFFFERIVEFIFGFVKWW